MKTYTQMKSIQDFNKKALLGALLAAGLAMGSGSAAAATATFGVTATVEQTCVVGNGATMAFGTLALLNVDGTVVTTGNDDATTTFPVACTAGATGVTFAFDGTAAAGFALKSTATPADTIVYTLASDSGYTVPIVKATAQTSANFAGFLANGTNRTLTVYGRIALASAVTAPVHADYADTVTITVTY